MGEEKEEKPDLDEALRKVLQEEGGQCSCGGTIVRVHGPGVIGPLCGSTGWEDICNKCGRVHGRSPGGVIF